MAQPAVEQPPIQQQEQPGESGSHVAQVAAAAAMAALTAGAAKAAVAPPAAAVRSATKTLLDGVDLLFRRRRQTFAAYIVSTAQHQMPGVSADRVSLLAAEELRNEAAFQRKQRERLASELPQALSIADPTERAAKVAQLMEREKRFLRQREQAAAQRLVGALEADLLKQASPLGAFWRLSPLVREHCPRCLALAGKFWPWEVLEANRIPMHPNCACSLLSLDEAIGQGLMTKDQISEKGEAIDKATQLVGEASRLEEALTHEEQHELVKVLELEVVEASFRELLRWGKGTEHGGEFKPKGGGDPGAKVIEKAAHQLAFPGEHAHPLGRTVTIKGEKHWISKGEDWEHVVGKTTYSSPWGTTRVYKNGQLLSQNHKDLEGTVPIATKTPDGGATWLPSDYKGGPSKPFSPPPEPKIEPAKAPAGIGKEGVPDYTGTKLEMGKSAGGSTGARWAFDQKGDRWLVKTYKGNQDRVATELLANAVYREMGAKVAPAGTYYAKADGKPIVALAYPTLPGDTRKIDEPSKALGAHYMTDALVANWDFIGLTDDNVLWQPDGSPARLDQGGTFQFRAQGASKPYGPVPSEVWTMLQPKGQGFEKVDVSEAAMKTQARQIAERMTPERVHQLVAAAPFDSQKMRGEVEHALNGRVQWMREFADGEQELPRPLAGPDVGNALSAAQERLNPSPEQLAALHHFAGDERLQRRMQERLREGSKLTVTQNQMRLGMDNLLHRARTPEDLTVYRGIDTAQLGEPEKLVGKVVKDKAFAAATTDRSAASAAPGMLRIHVPAGSSALHVHSLEGVSRANPHTELLLPRQTRLRVKHVETRPDGKTIVHASVIG